MIDINELRRLAQAATPGPWKMLPVGDGRQKFAVADSEFLSILTVTDEGGATFGTVYDDADAKFIAAVNPATISELLDRLEATEKERNDFAQQLVQSEITRREISEAHNAVTRRLSVLADENTTLRAKIEATEKQGLVGVLHVALAEKVTSESTLRDLDVGNNFINATFEGDAIQHMLDALADQFVESGASNYIEMQFHSKAGPFSFTLQRVDGKTPHQLRVEAEKERDVLRAELSKQQALTDAAQHIAEVAQSRANQLQAKITEMRQPGAKWFDWLPQGTTHISSIMTVTIPCFGLKARFNAFKYIDGVLYTYMTDSDNEYGKWVKAASRYRNDVLPTFYPLSGAHPAPSVPDGFSREDLEAVADGLDGYEKTANVGNVTGEGDDHLESTTAYAARFIRTMLAAAPEAKP